MIKRIFGYVLAGALLAGLPVMAQKGSTSGPTQVKDVDKNERQRFQLPASFSFAAGSMYSDKQSFQVPSGKIMVIEQVTPYCDLGASASPAMAMLTVTAISNGTYMHHYIPVDVNKWTGTGGLLYNTASSVKLTRIYADPDTQLSVTFSRRTDNNVAVGSNSCHTGITGYYVDVQ